MPWIPGPVPQDDPAFAHTRRARRWTIAITIIAVILLFAACAFGGYLVINDDRNPPRDANPSASASLRDISSQSVDPAPLTVAELFGAAELTPVPGEPAYTVLSTQESPDCKIAATDRLGARLVELGCSQVVRGTLKHPTGQYLVTAGLFNLKDEINAQQAHQEIEPGVNAGQGRFTGLLAGAGTEAIVRAATQLGWKAEGHFLAYCVIARADGENFTEGDEYPRQIIFDLVNTYLVEGVVGARTVNPSSAPSPGG